MESGLVFRPLKEEDYETKYNELVNRIKNTSKNQLQKLKNEL